MAAVALPTVTVKWVQPLLQVNPQNQISTMPFLAEFENDRFMPQFLDMMAGKTAIELKHPHDTMVTSVVDGLPNNSPQRVYKLYQPFHRRYYLVTASLVCRHLGLPDHTVSRKDGEKVSFVLRRFIAVNGTPAEHGWVDKGTQKGWQPIAYNALLPDEERLPLHPVKVQPPSLSGTPSFKAVRASTIAPADQRVVYHGYIPAASREKYLTPVTNAAQLIQNEITNPPPLPALPPTDPRLDEVSSRVIEPWFNLFATPGANLPPAKSTNPSPGPPTLEEVSLFLLVDLGDFLQTNLLEVFNALIAGTDLPSDGTHTERQHLLVALRSIQVWFYPGGVANGIGSAIFLRQAIGNVQNVLGLASGQGNEPADDYNVLLVPFPATITDATLTALFSAALAEDRKTRNNWLIVPPELAEVIKVEPANGTVFFLRLVYEHAPCDPVLSDPTPAFTFAKYFDPDAPARPIRIELPSIKPKDLRKYKRGVGLQFSPELNNLLGRVKPGMLKGDPLAAAGANANIGIAFICSFSISITFLLAIIIMFIFLFLFNIIFWWVAFIKICFPVPTKK